MRKARAAQETLRSKGLVYLKTDLRAAVKEAMTPHKDEAFEGCVDFVTDQLDRSSIKEDPSQPRQRWLFDLDGVLKLGDNRRIDIRFALQEHVQAALDLDAKNMDAVVAANLRKKREWELLAPYLAQGMDVEHAVTQYQQDHPEEYEAAS
jgi:hypothetical protein